LFVGFDDISSLIPISFPPASPFSKYTSLSSWSVLLLISPSADTFSTESTPPTLSATCRYYMVGYYMLSSIIHTLNNLSWSTAGNTFNFILTLPLQLPAQRQTRPRSSWTIPNPGRPWIGPWPTSDWTLAGLDPGRPLGLAGEMSLACEAFHRRLDGLSISLPSSFSPNSGRPLDLEGEMG
jgi:hypothetical protein